MQVALAVERPTPEPGTPSLPYEEWQKWTWKQFYSDVKKTATAFIELGLPPGSAEGSVSIFAQNCPEWIMVAAAAGICGAKSAGTVQR